MSASAAAPRPALVRDLLTDLYRTPVVIESWDRLEPWSVARVLLSGTGGGGTIIVKWVRIGAAEARSERWRVGRELAALQFLSDDLGLTVAPRVIAADLGAGFLVLEDLAPRVALDHLICRDGVEAHLERLAVFARALGELGAVTVGRVETFRARCLALGSQGQAVDHQGQFAELWERGREIASALEAPIAGPAAAELTAVIDELASPGAFFALSNGDAESNNVLVHESGSAGARLIDFEAAGYRHALLDAVCLHVPGPRWISVAGPSTAGLAEHYRHALARGVPQAREDRLYGFALAAACMSWALLRLQRFVALDERAAGDHSRLQLVETLEAAARTAAAHRALPWLTGWLWRLAEALRRRWPDTDVELTDPVRFPPYSPRL